MTRSLRAAAKLPLLTAGWLLGPQRWGGGTTPQLWILMYHRVLPAADPRFGAEEPGMVVTPETLDLHLQIAKQRFTLISLEEWITRRDAGHALPRRACAITFDDGWLDNYEYALPVLERHQVPATIFVVAEMLGSQRRFWPNRLTALLAQADVPEVRSALSWLTPLLTSPVTCRPDRERLATIVGTCKQQSDDWLNARLDEAEQRIGEVRHRGEKPSLMNWEQLTRMQASGLVSVGSHTCNHYRLLPQLHSETLQREIISSKTIIEERLGKPATLFCFPNGDADHRARALVAQHYRAAVTTQRGINSATSDAHQLKRIALHEDGSHTAMRFEARLSAWT
jgi:peptidoglycan/xylan/chitin deacetylase (PgdA/CDA1 family)